MDYLFLGGVDYTPGGNTRGGGKLKSSKTAKSAKTAKTTKTAKTAKTAKTVKEVKIPKKVVDEITKKINVMYKVFNKKNKGMKGGGDINYDAYFNTTDLALSSFLPTPYDTNLSSRLHLSNFAN